MHCLNLGVDLWIVGNVIVELLTYDHMWGGPDLSTADRLLLATQDFRQWARQNKWQYPVWICNIVANYVGQTHSACIYIKAFDAKTVAKEIEELHAPLPRAPEQSLE